MSNTSELPLSHHNALVLGGSSGIGLACAAELIRGGATVTLAARNRDKLHAAAEQLCVDCAVTADVVRVAVCDGTVERDVAQAVAVAAEPHGRLDIAIGVAGGGSGGPVALMEAEAFAQTVAEGPLPVFLLIKHAAPLMMAGKKSAGEKRVEKGGSIVAISSISAVLSGSFLAAYGGGKAALDTLVRIAADELGSHGIRVNGVRPGFTLTPSTQALADVPGYVEGYLAEQALQQVGEARDIAAAVRFLAGPESRWITGQLLNVDGGLSLHRIPRRSATRTDNLLPEAWKTFLG